MAQRRWTRDELILAMNLYCRLPFGQFTKSNPEVIRLATAIGRTPSSVGMKLCNFASLDPHHQERGVKGLTSTSVTDRQIWGEFHADWARLAAESEAVRERLLPEPEDAGIFDFRPGDFRLDADPPESLETPQSKIENHESKIAPFTGPTDAEAIVRVRRAQRFFRRAVLTSYAGQCCISGIALPQLLVASHILPWSTHPEHRANPSNGLCLSRLHDAAFDQGLITFDLNLCLVLSAKLRDATENPVLNASFIPYEGRPMRLPEKFRPDTRFLERHRAEVFQV